MARGISQEDIQKVREASDIVEIVGQRTPLKQRGVEFWGCCPFHNEKTPSFKVDSSTQLWHCFGCGEGGDVFGFVMKSEDMNFPEAVRHLAEKAHIDISDDAQIGATQGRKKRLKDICAATAEFYHSQLMRGKSPGASEARAYLSSRSLGGEIPKIWNLGFAPGRNALMNHLQAGGFSVKEMVEANVVVSGNDGKLRDRFYNRVMFPILDVGGEPIAFGGRIIGEGKPKYLNSQETPIFHKSNVLYGLDKAKGAMASTGVAVVAEGYTDVIALHRAGIKNAVATLGTSLTKEHIRQLSRHAGKRIIYLFDGDEAGQRATERALQFIDNTVTPEAGVSRIEICALTLPDGQDPAEFLEASGADAMKEQLASAKPLIGFGIERRLHKHNLDSAEGRSLALADVLAILAPIKDSILAKEYAIQIAGMLRMREQDVLSQLETVRPPAQQQYRDTPDGSRPSSAPGRQMRSLPKSERNRLLIEREFLGLSAQNPLLALGMADTLVKTKWQSDVHSAIAETILSVLTEDLGATPARIIEAASAAAPDASSILTSAGASGGEAVQDKMAFLAAELSIGDKEAEVGRLKSELALSASGEETEGIFERLVVLQNELKDERLRLQSM